MAAPTIITVPNYHPPCSAFAGLTEGGCTTGKNNKRANYCGKIHATTLVVDGSFNPGTYSHVIWEQNGAAGAIIPTSPVAPALLSDVFVPEGRAGFDELGHQADALRGV